MGKKDKLSEVAEQLQQASKDVVIEQPKVFSVGLEVAGTAEVIHNCFSQKSIEQMLRKHMGLSVQREVKKPRELIEQATVRNMEGRVCIPPTAFKKAMLTASVQLKALKKTQLRICLFVEGQSIPITFDEMVPRMDVVRTAGMSRAPDIRFRPSFINWRARLCLQFADTLSVQSVVDLLNRAGSVGVCEWRPEKDGVFGTFHVVRHITDKEEIAEVRKECSVPLVRPRIPDWALDMDIDPSVIKKAFDELAVGEGNGAESKPATKEDLQEVG